MEFPLYSPILSLYRSGYIDNRFFGIALLCSKNEVKFQIGSGFGAKFYLRSLFKPIQASIINEDMINHFHFTEQELAVMQASHAGEKIHIALIKSILKKIGLSENELLCPIIPPLNTKGVRKYTKLHNNCSGKHSMMLSWCVYNGFDYKNYTDFNHPIQRKILETLLKFAETKDFIKTKDGCTAPVYGLKLNNTAQAFLNFYENETILTRAYKNNPYIIGGSDDFGKRTDTKIMELNRDLISKVGAGGFIYVYNIKKKEILIVKMAQDNNLPREIVALEILYRINWLEKRFYDDKTYTEAHEEIGNYVLEGLD